MPSLFRSPRPQALIPSVLLAIFIQALSMSAYAEFHVTGESDAIKIEANEASVEELLIALSEAYGLQYRSSANLSRSVSGTFEGPLQQVLSRLLQGYNFAVETSANGTMVAVYVYPNWVTMRGETISVPPGVSTAHGSNVDLAPKTASAPSPLHGFPKRVQGRGHRRR
jgi:type II secretory pathway component GspD/PulD (secretin)